MVLAFLSLFDQVFPSFLGQLSRRTSILRDEKCGILTNLSFKRLFRAKVTG
jgi:hypothetical protein